jgi:hypothetical protein
MELSASILYNLLFLKTLAGYLCAVGICALVYLSIGQNRTRTSYAALCFWICAWTMYDVFGYEFVVLTNGQCAGAIAAHKGLLHDYQVSLNAYRIIQMTFQWVLTFLVVFAVGWRVCLAANLIWWGANCDMLYYFITWKSLPQDWTWLGWTPVGIFMTSIPLSIVILQAIALLAAAILVMKWHLNRFLDGAEGSGAEGSGAEGSSARLRSMTTSRSAAADSTSG